MSESEPVESYDGYAEPRLIVMFFHGDPQN